MFNIYKNGLILLSSVLVLFLFRHVCYIIKKIEESKVKVDERVNQGRN